ncbi:hypothetical protein DFJ77DRAFT_21006 [Powellomyces hirtus]|nr:hypothetical protein DFJ77DRAFT_21006 [Powellomyces hirtus]
MQRNGFAPPRHQGPCVDPALESEIQQFAASGVLGSPRDNVWEGLRSSEIPPLSQHRSSDLDIRNPAAYRQFMSALGMDPGAPLRSVLISVGPAADGNLENVPVENYASLRRRQESEYAIRQVKDGIDAFQQNDYETALRKYRTALEQDPNCVDAYVARGALYAKQDQFNKAIQDFKDALDVNPDHANAAAYLRMTENKLADIEREKQSAAMGEFLMLILIPGNQFCQCQALKPRFHAWVSQRQLRARSPTLVQPVVLAKTNDWNEWVDHHNRYTD